MRSLFRNERFRKVLGKIILGIAVFAAAAQVFYILLAGGAFRWIVKHDYPYNHPGSTWESEDPRIYLHVVDKIPSHGEAYLVIDDEEIPLEIQMDPYGTRIDFRHGITTELLLVGRGRFSSERVKIRINKDFDTLYDGAYSEIILYRTDNP